MTLLCCAPHCGLRGRHTDNCDEPACAKKPHDGSCCRGCLPRRAADGLRLCHVDTRRISEDTRTAATLYLDLEPMLIPNSGRSQRITGHGSAPAPRDEAVEARSAIRATLVSLARLIADERGFDLPADEIPAIAAYIVTSADWLAAHPAAGVHAKDLRDIAGDTRTWRLAYPVGSDRLYLGLCPHPVTGDNGGVRLCEQRIYAIRDEPLVACQRCGTSDTVEQWQRWMVGDLTGVVTLYAAAAILTREYGRDVHAEQLRKWTRAGRVATHGRDTQGRTLVDLDEIRRHAEHIWRRSVSVNA